MKFILIKTLTVFIAIFSLHAAQTILAQTPQKLSKLDQTIQTGFDSLKARKWLDAVKSFEEAQKIHENEKKPSELLFTLFSIPDEEEPPSSAEARQIISWRHSMATSQALLEFLSFSNQLAGNSAQAQKYSEDIYRMRGVMWGRSWDMFMPLFFKVFNDLVKDEKGENAGRYQYLAASLLLDAGTDNLDPIFELMQKAHQNAPKDAEVAGFLANGFLQKRNPKEAKRAAELSLSLKPNEKSVLIDLATAEWLLGEFDNSIKHSEDAIKIDPQAPGPHLTLALNYIDKKDFPRALSAAETAVGLSRRHFWYLTVQAAVFEASGKEREAEKLLREAWKDELPSYEVMDNWYTNKTLRDLVLKIVDRLGKPKGT